MTNSGEVAIPVLAVVSGEPVTELPPDLYIPPEALEVLLESFSGPLDLLLYLIRRQNFDILDIPIAVVTEQYIQYMHLIKQRHLELAADYLLMAAMLAEIKSRLLLPVIPCATEEESEDDPRLQLVRQLQAYEQMKVAALALDALSRTERDVYTVHLPWESILHEKPVPLVTLDALHAAYQRTLQEQVQLASHTISRETLSVRDRMQAILHSIDKQQMTDWHHYYRAEEGRLGVVVTLLAILELAKQAVIFVIQTHLFSSIYVKGQDNSDD